jgi:hypothetical protein
MNGRKTYPCSFCPRRFKRYLDVVEHGLNEHSGDFRKIRRL